MDIFASGRALFLLAHLHAYSRNIGSAFAHLLNDLPPWKAFAIGRQLHEDIADLVRRSAAAAKADAGAAAGPGVGKGGLHTVDIEQDLLNLDHKLARFLGRDVAARAYEHTDEFWFRLNEEQAALVARAIGNIDCDQQQYGRPYDLQRMLHQPGNQANVRACPAAHACQVTALGRRKRPHLPLVSALRPPDERAKHRQEQERHEKRGDQHKDERDRQVLHELARDPGPEQHRYKGRERCTR